MSKFYIEDFDRKVFTIFPKTEILTLEEFMEYPLFCPLDSEGKMFYDPEHNIEELVRIYKINDFEPSEDELDLLDISMIQVFSDGNSMTGFRVMGYGTDSFREKIEKLFL